MNNISMMAKDYQESAELVHERIKFLLKCQACHDKAQKNIEDRLNILRAERSYLRKMAGYLGEYYTKKGSVSIRNKQVLYEVENQEVAYYR